MTDLNKLTLKKAQKLVSEKQVKASEIQQACINQIKAVNGDLNMFLSHLEDPASGQEGALASLPIAVKDNVCTLDFPTTASSKLLEGYRPPYEATIMKKVKNAGGVVLGKTNLDAWAHGSSTETSAFGRTLNPRNSDFLPGGSSGGSAAAVASDTCVVAIGTETAGSIRQPSAWCGVVGLKPTYGRVSRYGIAAMASSTDSPGPIAKTVEDAAMLLDVMAGHDPFDATSNPDKPPSFVKSIDKKVSDLRVGVLYQDLEGLELVRPHIDKAAGIFESLGANVEYAEAMDPHYAISVYTIVQRAEVSSNLARYTGIRYGNDRSFFGDEAKRRIMLGTHALRKGYADKYYLTAQKVRAKFALDYDELFKKYDVLISASSPTFAEKIGASESSSMFGELADMLQEPSSICGLPGINVPVFRDPETNLFLGLNIVAPAWREDLVIQFGDAYEKATSWNSWRNND